MLLGAQPLKKHYGGVLPAISAYSEKLVGRKFDFSELSLPKVVQVEVGDPHRSTSRASIKTPAPAKQSEEKEAYDRISDEDKSELNSLLGRLTP